MREGIEEFNPRQFVASFLTICVAVLTSPKTFFANMATKGGFREPVLFLALCVVAFTIVSAFIAPPYIKHPFAWALGCFVMPFLVAGVLNFVTQKVTGIKCSYETTFRIKAYMGAIYLIYMIPVFGILFGLFYEIYLTAIGLNRVYKIEIGQAVTSVLVTQAIFVIAFIYLVSLAPHPVIG